MTYEAEEAATSDGQTVSDFNYHLIPNYFHKQLTAHFWLILFFVYCIVFLCVYGRSLVQFLAGRTVMAL